VVCDTSQLPTAFDVAAATSLSKRVVVQHYLDGPEVSVEAVTWAPGATEILAVTEKTTTPPPVCVELAHTVPASLTATQDAQIARTVTSALDALGMTAGVSHTELKLTRQGVSIIETAGRPAGDHIPRLVHFVTGWNLYLAELAAASGTALKPDPPTAESASVRFFTGTAGRPMRRPRDLVAKVGSGALRRTLRDIRYTLSEGAMVPALSANRDRCGFAIVAGDRHDTRQALAELAHLEPLG
jgi:biotin carboxylase